MDKHALPPEMVEWYDGIFEKYVDRFKQGLMEIDNPSYGQWLNQLELVYGMCVVDIVQMILQKIAFKPAHEYEIRFLRDIYSRPEPKKYTKRDKETNANKLRSGVNSVKTRSPIQITFVYRVWVKEELPADVIKDLLSLFPREKSSVYKYISDEELPEWLRSEFLTSVGE